MNKAISVKETKAWKLAEELHKDQIRKFTNLPYFDAHVQKVNGIVKFYTTDEDILCASLLHDTLEDCFDDVWKGYKKLKKEFGKRVAELVMELTSDKNEIKYRFDGSKTKYLIEKLSKMSSDAFTIKLCDRLQNIEDTFNAGDDFRNKYYLETVVIIKVIKKKRRFNKSQYQLISILEYKLNNIKNIFNL